MKSIVTFVCLCALWFDVGRSRILRHEKTWMRAKSRTSTDSILQGCLSEASGSKLSGVAGETTREKQLTYFQSEFQRINTELKTIRDEMYADGGTDRTQRNLFNMNNLAECVLKDPKLLDIDGWDAFMTVYHDIKQIEVEKTDERNGKAHCIVLLMIQDPQTKSELSMDDDTSFSTSLSGWLKDLHTTPAAEDHLYPAMKRLVAKEDDFVKKETVLGKAMDGTMPHSAMVFVNIVAPYAVAKTTPKIALSQFLGMGFGGATETALSDGFDWSKVYDSVFDEAEGIAKMSMEELDNVPSEMQEWYDGYEKEMKQRQQAGDLDGKAYDADTRTKTDVADFDTEAFDSKAFKEVAGNTLVIYGIYSSISGLVSNPKSVEGWLTMGSTIADVSDMIAEGTAKLMSHMGILKTLLNSRPMAFTKTER